MPRLSDVASTVAVTEEVSQIMQDRRCRLVYGIVSEACYFRVGFSSRQRVGQNRTMTLGDGHETRCRHKLVHSPPPPAFAGTKGRERQS